MVLIAKISYQYFDCYCCIYPHSFSAEYIVFVDIDNGTLCLLLSTIRDKNFYPNDGRRIHMLKEGLFLLDSSKAFLFTLHEEMLCQPHPDAPSRH